MVCSRVSVRSSPPGAEVPKGLERAEDLGNHPTARREPVGWSIGRDIAAAEEGGKSLLHDPATGESIVQIGFPERAAKA